MAVEYKIEPDLELKQFATDKQWKKYLLYCEHGGYRPAEKETKIDEALIRRAVKKIRKKASIQGYAPDYGMDKTVPNEYTVKGISTLYDGAGNKKAEWVKTSAKKEHDLAIIRATIEGLTEYIQPIQNISNITHRCLNDKLSVIVLPDMHIGLLCEQDLVGQGWDVKTALKSYEAGMIELIESLPATEKVLIINLGDIAHMNDSSNSTPISGNTLDVDGRVEKTVRACASFMRFTIDNCLNKFNKVEIRNILGNHSYDIGVAINVTLGMMYENTERVNVSKISQIRDYYRFGKTIIGMTHHGKGKPANLGLLMAQECRDIWSETEYTYMYSGHVHSMSKFEECGVVIESFRTLIPRDKWTFTQGYFSGRQLTAIIIDKDYGECGRRIVGIKQINDKIKQSEV